MPDEPKTYWQQDEPEAFQPPAAPVDPAEPTDVTAEDSPTYPTTPDVEPLRSPAEPITWSAEEYVHPDKGVWWYVAFTLVALALIAIDMFFLKSWTFSALVIVMFIALIVYIRRPARTLTYSLSPAQGLYVGEVLHSFDDYKSFGVLQDGTHNSIMLIPRKRFALGVSVFFPDEVGEEVVDILGQRLPMETLKLDVVDAIVRKLRL